MIFLTNKNIHSLTLVITRKCNLNCDYCYNDQRDEEMSEGVLEQSIAFFLQSSGRNKKITFLGGEPNLRPEFLAAGIGIIRSLGKKYKKTARIIINTNGTLLNERILENYGKVDFISVSLDGKAETHNLHRKKEQKGKTFSQVIEHIKIIQEKFPGKLIINKVITSKNYKNFFRDIRFIYSLKPRFIAFNLATGDQGWTARKAKQFLAEAKKTARWIKRRSAKDSDFKRIFEYIRIGKPECILSDLTIDPAGRIFSCEFAADAGRGCLGDLSADKIKPDLLACRFSLKNERCRKKQCQDCGGVCFRNNFSRWIKDSACSGAAFLQKLLFFKKLFV